MKMMKMENYVSFFPKKGKIKFYYNYRKNLDG